MFQSDFGIEKCMTEPHLSVFLIRFLQLFQGVQGGVNMYTLIQWLEVNLNVVVTEGVVLQKRSLNNVNGTTV